MRTSFEEQFSKWTARAPFFSLRARLLLLGALTLLPAFGFILYSTLKQRQEAAEQKTPIGVIRLQLQSLAKAA